MSAKIAQTSEKNVDYQTKEKHEIDIYILLYIPNVETLGDCEPRDFIEFASISDERAKSVLLARHADYERESGMKVSLCRGKDDLPYFEIGERFFGLIKIPLRLHRYEQKK